MKIKRLIFNLVIPITIITFFTITKWWYVLPIDGTDSMFYGFPLIWYGEAWHTSMAIQFFVLEMIFDLTIYFLFWLTIISILNKNIINIKLNKFATIFLWIITFIVLILFMLIGNMKENRFNLKRSFEIKTLDTGTKFIWKNIEKPDYKNINTEKN